MNFLIDPDNEYQHREPDSGGSLGQGLLILFGLTVGISCCIFALIIMILEHAK